VKVFICKDGTELPVFVRTSAKAKRWRLQLSHKGELEVVIPEREARRFTDTIASDPLLSDPSSPATAFLESHRQWIERAVRRTKSQREAYEESRSAGLPTHLDFPLADEIWLVEYRPTTAHAVSAKPDGLRRIQGVKQIFALKLSGATADEELCRKALMRFTVKRAKELIPPFAWGVCNEIHASPKSITVNNRKSAWGVCTQTGDIRIDRRVLFFPTDMARQVVLHEAAHLKHLNHSERFYRELYSYEGSTQEAEQAVKKGVQLIPAWFIDAS
jgi:predicted metal-dependent hydrolase